MDVPIITDFLNGLKLFWANKRLKWLFGLFMLGLIVTTVVGNLMLIVVSINPLASLVAYSVLGGIWPVFFMLAAFLSLLGLQRFVASEDSYGKSFALFFVWMLVSVFTLAMLVLFFFTVLAILIFGVAFIGWIGFQAYFATRTSLKYADIATREKVGRALKVMAGLTHIVCYVVVFGALIFTLWLYGGTLIGSGNVATVVFLVLGTLFAAVFNFMNGIVLARNRNKPVLANISLLGFFIAAYSAYFIYSVGSSVAVPFDLVGITVSLFFVLYTMSAVGRTLASRATKAARFKISAEVAAAFTFFLAAGYYFSDNLFEISAHVPGGAILGASLSGIVKLFIFPFVAMIGEFVYLRRLGKPPAAPTAEVTEQEAPGETTVEPSGSAETPSDVDAGQTTRDEQVPEDREEDAGESEEDSESEEDTES
ncbi:MAG: hypothetical protein HXY34_03845 [Candidatus Thorarchaeota archaeon]|nr:hypothetical protein [Candidatus Thorarchaeota archaeon]